MKTLIISRDELEDNLSALWQLCEEHHGTMLMNPAEGMIRVFKDDETLVELGVFDVTDNYDLKREVAESLSR